MPKFVTAALMKDVMYAKSPFATPAPTFLGVTAVVGESVRTVFRVMMHSFVSIVHNQNRFICLLSCFDEKYKTRECFVWRKGCL